MKIVDNNFINNENENYSFLWEKINKANRESISLVNGRKYSCDFTTRFRHVLLFLDPIEDCKLIIKLNSEDLCTLLDDTFIFMYYLSNEECTFLMCFNDHDYLIGSGISTLFIKDLENNLEVS